MDKLEQEASNALDKRLDLLAVREELRAQIDRELAEENWKSIAARARELSAELDKPVRRFISGPPSTGHWKSKIYAARSWKSVADYIDDALKYSEQAGVNIV